MLVSNACRHVPHTVHWRSKGGVRDMAVPCMHTFACHMCKVQHHIVTIVTSWQKCCCGNYRRVFINLNCILASHYAYMKLSCVPMQRAWVCDLWSRPILGWHWYWTIWGVVTCFAVLARIEDTLKQNKLNQELIKTALGCPGKDSDQRLTAARVVVSLTKFIHQMGWWRNSTDMFEIKMCSIDGT